MSKALGFTAHLPVKNRTTLRLQSSLLMKLTAHLQANGYGLKRRSEWICESIILLNSTKDPWSIVTEEFMDDGNNEVIPLTYSKAEDDALSKLIETCRLNAPAYNVDRSRIIRSAIIQRLVRETGGLM